MLNKFDLDILRSLGDSQLISNIVENNFDNEKEFYDWWNDIAKRNNLKRSEILNKNCIGFKVQRKTHGIPKITADTDNDLFYGYGMTLAHDRLFQLDYLRRKAYGTLSEVMGVKTFDIDLIAKTIDFKSIAEKEYNSMPNWSKELLNSFAEGINNYIDINNDFLPLEFSILDYTPDNWTAVDSLAIMSEFRYYLTVRMPLLVMSEYARKYISDRDLLDIYVGGEADDETILFDGEYVSGVNNSNLNGGSISSSEDGLGSNNWVIGSEKSETKYPLLASDPHIAFSAISCWYQVQLEGDKFNVMGMSYAGVPGIFMGRNKDVAWGITNNICSQRDLYYEKLNKNNKNQYLYDSNYLEFDNKKEVIKIKGQEDSDIEIKSTINGPVVNKLLPEWVDIDQPVTLKWLGFEYCSFITDLFGINLSSNANEFLNSFQDWKVPTLSLVYATKNKDFGYQSMGKIPIRENHFKGIKPGWDKKYQWTGLIPNEDMPGIKNPKRNWIGTANNRPAKDDFKYPLFGTWSSGHRMRRIRKRLESENILNMDIMKSIQYDMHSERAIECLPHVLEIIKNNPNLENIYNILKEWDYDTNADSVATTIFEMFFNDWSHTLTKEWFPENIAENIYPSAAGIANYLLKNEDKHNWIKSKTRSNLIEETMERVVKDLTIKFGDNTENWRWGNLHKINLTHPISILGDLSKLFDRGGFEVGGTGVTVCNTGFDPNYLAPMGANLRLIVDMSTDGLLIIDSQGISGDPGSENYCDQSESWVNGDFVNLEFGK